jgi:putative solute:sodium symporter small subunit
MFGIQHTVTVSLVGQRGEATMIDWRERRPYWRHTKWQMVATLVPFLIAVVVLPLFVGNIETARVLGSPLGFFLICHGLIVISGVVTAVWVNRQREIDRWHGANEDL